MDRRDDANQRRVLCFVVVLFGLLSAPPASRAQKRDLIAAARARMVERFIEAEGVNNPRVLDAMRSVPRHQFVEGRHRSNAYLDAALPIGYSQTISPPFIVAFMTESIDPRPTDRVLEIGTGSGYQAAILSQLVQEVYTIEIVAPLGRKAAKRLKKPHYTNVTAKIGDGYKGWPEHAPFDKIIVTCSPEDVPKPLAEQLKEGGKMIIPLGERYQQVFYLFEKRDGKLVPTKLIPTLFVPMTGISEARREIKPDPANPNIVNGDFEADENGDGRADNWHYQRQVELVRDAVPEGTAFIQFENQTPGHLAQLLQGIGLDGRKVRALRMTLSVKYEETKMGRKKHEQPALLVHFYDATRRPLGEGVLGPWIGSSDWETVKTVINVPPKAREAIVRIGLNGATGRLSIDDVRLEPVGR